MLQRYTKSDNACHCILLDLLLIIIHSSHHLNGFSHYCNSISFKGESGELAPVLVEPRFVTSLVFFFILLGALWKVRRMKFAQRGRQKRNLLGRGHQQHPQRTRIWIVRAIVRVIRALWWCIKALCRLPRLLLGALADVAAAITMWVTAYLDPFNSSSLLINNNTISP